jgi:hypothetical protein
MSFMERPWWIRAWVAQEVACAQSLEVLSSTHHLSWPRMIENLGITYWTLLYKHKSLFSAHTTRMHAAWVILARAKEIALLVQSSGRLLDVLVANRERHATDARDKVFALLGLVRHVDLLEFSADYSLSAPEVYMAVAYQIMKTTQTLRVLAHKETELPKDNLPSWAPDWSNRTQRVTRAVPITHWDSDSKLFAAGGQRDLNAQVDLPSRRLKLLGRNYDKILEACDDVPSPGLENWLKWFIHLQNWFLQQHKDGIPSGLQSKFLMGFARIASGGSLLRTKSGSYEIVPERITELELALLAWWLNSPIFIKRVSAVLRAWKQNDNQDEPSDIMSWLEQKMFIRDLENYALEYGHSDSSLAGLVYRWYASVMLLERARCMHWTSTHKLVLGPRDAVRGDVIFVPVGAQVPLVIREQAGGGYTFVGECYYDDIMDGEAMRDIDDKELHTVVLG